MSVSPRRLERVRVLLLTLDDVYDSTSRRETKLSGFAEPTRRRYQHATCGGTGCDRCERGYVTVQERDAYDKGKALAGKPKTVTMSTYDIDRTLERLAEIEPAHVPWYSVLARSARRDREASYAELRRALALKPVDLRGEAAVEWLAEHMRGPIRIPRAAFELECEELAEACSALASEGLKDSEIARELGISRRRVKTLRERKEPA